MSRNIKKKKKEKKNQITTETIANISHSRIDLLPEYVSILDSGRYFLFHVYFMCSCAVQWAD